MVRWNKDVRVILSDVDKTIADNFTPAEPAMINELSSLLREGKKLVFIPGPSLVRILQRIVDAIEPSLRKGILISHCSGAEVWGFEDSGELKSEPYYTLYEDMLDERQRSQWREIIQQLIKEFKDFLQGHSTVLWDGEKRLYNGTLEYLQSCKV